MNQTWEKGKNTNFGADFGLFWPKFGPLKLFLWVLPQYILNIVSSYHCMQFQGKLMNQTWKNGKKN